MPGRIGSISPIDSLQFNPVPDSLWQQEETIPTSQSLMELFNMGKMGVYNIGTAELGANLLRGGVNLAAQKRPNMLTNYLARTAAKSSWGPLRGLISGASKAAWPLMAIDLMSLGNDFREIEKEQLGYWPQVNYSLGMPYQKAVKQPLY